MSFDLSHCPDVVYTLEPNCGRMVSTAMIIMFLIGMAFGGSVVGLGNACGIWIKEKILEWRDTL